MPASVRFAYKYLVLLLTFGAGLASPYAQGVDSAQGTSGASGFGPHAEADSFLAQARSWLEAGDLAQAGSMASSALELDPAYSETLYVRARVEAADRPSTRSAIEHLRAALRNANWVETDPLRAEQLLTDLLIRTGELAEARRTAERLTALRPEDSQNFILAARALDRAGSISAEQRTLIDALARFPQNEEIRLSAARVLQRQGRSAEASALVRTGLQIHPDSLPLLLAAAGLEIDRAKKVSDVDLFISKGGRDPLGPVLGMEAVPVRMRKKYLDLFISDGGLSRQDLVGRAVDAVKGNSALATTLRASLGQYTGNRDLDADLDGLWEDRWVFDNGKVVRWIREPAQDGVFQFSAEFRDGRPVSLASRDAAGNLTRLTYSRYPFLEKAELPVEGTLTLTPYTIQCVFLQAGFARGPAGSAPLVLAKISVPTADVLRRASFHLEEFGADGVTPIRRTDLVSGQPVFMEESSAGDGVMDHRLWYARGQPERGVRSLSRDGVFQVTESWNNGRLSSEEIDTDGDGIPDFRQTYGANSMKAWDFNEDGKGDIREYDAGDGTLVRELSTKMNGIFDLRIVSRGQRIISFSRGGTYVPIVLDTLRGLRWIGRPAPAGAKPDLTLPDGFQTIAGNRYLVFRHAGVTYAEAVQE
ncbi:MAG: tetratricopeptide repeat protein [Spirochaetia bacterium]|jgi:tetratricopeptide (TPR) repeat protein